MDYQINQLISLEAEINCSNILQIHYAKAYLSRELHNTGKKFFLKKGGPAARWMNSVKPVNYWKT